MSYNRKNYLLRVKKINELYKHHAVEDVPMAVTFRKHINPTYPMHLETFYIFLSIPYEAELKKIDALQKQQPKLF